MLPDGTVFDGPPVLQSRPAARCTNYSPVVNMLNPICVLATPRSPAGPFFNSRHIYLVHLDISTWCLKPCIFKMEVLFSSVYYSSNCSCHSLPCQKSWNHPWLLFLTHLTPDLSTSLSLYLQNISRIWVYPITTINKAQSQHATIPSLDS